jgi:hypothetical protein
MDIKRLVIVILFAVAFPSFADTITGNLFVDFETSTDGTQMTNSIMSAATHGSIGTSTWSTQYGDSTETPGAVPNITIENDAAFPLYTPVVVGGTTYSSAGTRGMRVVLATNGENSVDLPISGVTLTNPTSIGFNFRFNGAQINSSPRDVVGMRSDPTGGFQFLQLYDGNPPNFRAHFQPPYTVTTSGANIVKGRWYWVTMQHVGAGSTFRVRFYDTTNSYSMQEQSGTVETTSSGMTRLKIGGIRYNSGATQSVDFDNIVINTTGTYPLGPGTGVAPMLPVTRQIDWVNTGIIGGIPTRTTISQTVDEAYGNDSTDARAHIQAKINATLSGQVCFIPAGTYRINGALDIPSNITVRGAGRSSTILKAVGSATGLIRFGTGSPSVSTYKTISSGATAGSSAIVVNNTTGISIGSLLVITETNDAAYPVSNDGAVNDPATWVDGWNTNGTRARGQIVRVTNIAGTTLSISPALYTTYTNTPWANYFTPTVTRSGVESLTLYSTNSGTTANVVFNMASESWLYDVKSDFTELNHIDMRWCYRCELNKNHFFDGFDHSGECNVALRYKTSASRVVNNIFDRQLVGIYVQWGASGNVIGHNYFTGGYNNNASSGTRYLTNDIETSHGAHPQFNLVEGNILQKFRADSYWGTSSDTVLLRNYVEGVRISTDPYSVRGTPTTSFTLTQANFAVDLYEGQKNYSLIGNIIGNNGNWSSRGPIRKRTYPESSSYETPYAIRIGFTADAPSINPVLVSPTATLIDHGNWDSITDAISWDTTIIDHAIPESLYLTAKPEWFGTLTFPSFSSESVPSNLADLTNPAKYRYLTGSEPPGASDATPPSITIATSDPSNLTANTLAVTGSASDAVGVSGCKWLRSSVPTSSTGTACTGTTSFSCATSSYAQGANTLYVGCYDAAGNYGRDSIVVNLDSLAPTVSSRTIPSAGTTFTMVLSEPVQMAGAVPTLSSSGGPVTLSGCVAATNTITCNTSRQVLGVETLTARYTQPGNGIEDLVGNDLVSFSNQAVTNSSSQIIVDLSNLLPPTGTRYRKEVLSTTIGVTSSKLATCRHGSVPGLPWANLGAYTASNGITHSGSFSMSPGGGYQVCSRCFDTAAQQYSGDSCTRFSVRAIRKQPRW